MKAIVPYLLALVCLSSCVASKYNPNKKYSPEQLREDYTLFRNILEESHPSLYWYSPKDSIAYYFDKGEKMLRDSMTESRFRNVLSYVVAKFHCGHTSVGPSKAASRYFNRGVYTFPLYVKTWPDTTVVTLNLNRKDSNVSRGVVIESIDRRPLRQIIDSMFSLLSADGYNTTHKYQTLSNGGNFRSMYASLYGLRSKISVEYLDTLNNERTSYVIPYSLAADSQRRIVVQRPSKKERRESMRNMRIDTSSRTAFMEVNTFTKGNKLRRFFRKSFRAIHKDSIQNLVVDLRGNGGGSVTLSNLLTKYIANKPFKIADSLYAIRRGTHYGKYEQNHFLDWLFIRFLTKKEKDGRYHFAMYENKYFKPRTKNHFDGTTYILTGGNTFSAATLFTKTLVAQDNVIVVGEETGGGAYGNTAWLIPDITLPNTKVIFRLPLFRLVIDKNATKGRGVIPEVEADPTVDDIRKGVDYKMEKVKELIKEKETKDKL